jgi:argininosuccinate lyase
LVRAAVDRGKTLSELTEEELSELAPQLDGSFYELLDEGSWLESKVSDGGTAMSRVRDQLAQARQVLRTQVGASAPRGTGEASG